MTCRLCNGPSYRNLCGKCTLKQFGSPYTADLRRDEAYRQQRNERGAA